MDTVVFGACRVDLVRREIWSNDALCVVPPKVFDLLALLIQHEGAVVRKETLYQRVWGGRQVSDSVLANTVMKARKAIGDDGLTPSRIKTVHRVGYRLVPTADRSASDSPDRSTSATAAAQPPRRRIGLLPFVNQTGEAPLEWTGLGLSTLTGQALEAELALAIMPMAMMLKSLDGQPPSASDAQRASAVRRMLGLDVVVHAVLRRKGTLLTLDYRTFGESAALSAKGRVAGWEPTSLPELLASRLLAVVLEQPGSLPACDTEDSYAMETFARAMAFFARRQWESAIQLLNVLLRIEPHSVPGRLWLLRALVQTGDAKAHLVGDSLLAEACARGDERLQAQVHLALAHAVAYRVDEVAMHHVAEGLRLAKHHALDDEASAAEMVVASIAYVNGDHAASRAHFGRVEQSSRAVGNDLRLQMCMCNQVMLEMDDGHLLTAKAMAEELLALARRHEAPYAFHALASLAAIHAELGFLGRARDQLKQATTEFEPIEDSAIAARLLSVAAMVYRHTDDAAAIDEMLQRCAPLLATCAGMRQSLYQMVLGQRAACAGDLPLAAQLMREAIGASTFMALSSEHARWRLMLLEVELKARRWTAVRSLCDEIATLQQTRAHVDCQAAILRAKAAQMLDRGHRALAIEHLSTAMGLTPIGRLNALSRLDTAWLHIEDGHPTRAEPLLRSVEPWLTRHPLGMIVNAKLMSAKGAFQEASALHRQALAMYAGDSEGAAARRVYFHALQVLYDSAETAARRMPRAPVLPSLLQ